MTQPKLEPFIILDVEHSRGDIKCGHCYYEGYPKPHSCGGLLHISNDELGDDYLMVVEKCDKCDYEEKIFPRPNQRDGR